MPKASTQFPTTDLAMQSDEPSHHTWDLRQASPAASATRRDLFVTISAMLLTAAEAGTAKVAEIDGELLTAYARWLPLEQERIEVERLYAELGGAWDPALDERFNAYTNDWHYTAFAMQGMPAQTPEGVRVKARVLRAILQNHTSLGDHLPNSESTPAEDFAWALVNDLLAGSAGASATA